MVKFHERIKKSFDNLTSGMQKVAEFLLRHPDVLAIQTAEQVGQRIGVSETTVIRFTYALGYSGYSELQKEVREYVFDMKSSLQAYRQRKQEIKDKERLYERIMNNDRENILRTVRHINEEDFTTVVKKLTEAEKILVAGMRTSYSMAHWFAFTMDLVKGNTRLYKPGADDVILRVAEMDEKSVLVAFSFHRYVSETLKLAEAIQKNGSFVIGVTDSSVSPIGRFANVSLTVQLPVQSTLDAVPVCFSLLNAITSAVSLNLPEKFEKRQQMYETQHLESFFQ